jgi:hypothetical protein
MRARHGELLSAGPPNTFRNHGPALLDGASLFGTSGMKVEATVTATTDPLLPIGADPPGIIPMERHPPAIGAKLESADASSVMDIPGIAKGVQDRNLLGVVAHRNGCWSAPLGELRQRGRCLKPCLKRNRSGNISGDHDRQTRRRRPTNGPRTVYRQRWPMSVPRSQARPLCLSNRRATLCPI